MRNRVLLFISACFYYTGLIHFIRWWRLRSGKRLIVLNYHHADGKNLSHHLRYLRRSFRLLPLETALEELYTPCEERLPSRDRRPPLAITFDDGYDDNYTQGLPLVCELQVPITIFLISEYIESGTAFWWQDHLIRHAQVDEVTIEGRTYDLRQADERKSLGQMISARQESEEFLISLCESLGVSSSEVLRGKPDVFLTWAQVREMEASGWVSFGAHTIHHARLSGLSEPVEVLREVSGSREVLEAQLGHPIRMFAYPHGTLSDIGEYGVDAVRHAEFDWALTTVPGYNTSTSNRYLLHRFSADVSQHWLVIAARTVGALEFLSRLARIARHFVGA